MIEDPSSVVAAPRAPHEGYLLAFLAPGLVHALGNHLFAIQGCAHTLRDGAGTRRERATILEAAMHAEHALDVLRLLSGDPIAEPRPEQPGVLLARLAPLCRLPLRDHGLQLAIDHTSARRPRAVEARTFCRAFVDLLLHVTRYLPPFVEGTLRVDLADQDALSIVLVMRVEFAPTCLPFPMDVAAIGREFGDAYDAVGITAACDADGGLRIRVPAVR